MLRVGLTGGIGCGKSTVAGMMRDLGCRVIDADAISRELAEPGLPAYQEILAAFGSEILLKDGHIDRAKIAHLVFADASKLSTLNKILHPRVIAEEERQLVEIARTELNAVAVIEAALLIEAGHHRSLERLIVVWCKPEQQIERLANPQGRAMTREDATKRIAAQMPLHEKRRMATDEIDNSGSPAATQKQVTELVARLKTQAAAAGAK
jgi:dephospho-CoA kinase